MDRDELVQAQMLAYLNRLGTQYSDRRHATIVAHMALTFMVEPYEAETAIRQWLSTKVHGG